MIHLVYLVLKSFFTRKGHFLIVFQNNHELRATGGFITAVLDIGRSKLSFRKVFGELDSHAVVQGPKPLMEMLHDAHFKSWTFRDANYFPDFRESAEQMGYFYRLRFPGEKVHAVLAVNFSFVENFLKKLGTVHFKGRSLNHHQLFYFLTAEVSDIDRHSLEALANRKDILLLLAKCLVWSTLFRVWTWPSLLVLFRASFKNRDLQLYDAHFERSFSYERNQDFFAVIESNFLGLKSNRYISRDIAHESLMNTERQLKNEVRIVWAHLGDYDRPLSGTYHCYIRIYLPRLVSKVAYLSSHPVQSLTQVKEGDFCVLGFKLTLKPGEKFAMNLSYVQDFRHSEGYSFKFFKQSGVIRESLSKTLQVPKSLSVIPTNVGLVTENIYTASFAELNKDIELDIKMEASKRAPRILKHEVASSKTVMVRFSEPMALPIRQNFALFEKKSGDRLAIQSVKLSEDKTTLYLECKKLPQKVEAFYELRMKNIFSAEGQSIQPNPRTVTVVYRPRLFVK